MNIFALSECPVKSAQQMLDKHIIKMPTETCQMLHTNLQYMTFVLQQKKEPSLAELKAFMKDKPSEYMKPAMLNHPSTIWARQSKANFMWLYQHGLALCEEYKHRYGKEHGSYERILYCEKRFSNLVRRHNYPLSGLTPVTIAMDDSYRIDLDEYSQRNPNWTGWDFVIESYRHYYREGKWEIAEWKKDRQPIDWFPENWFAIKWNRRATAYNNAQPRKYPMPLMEE